MTKTIFFDFDGTLSMSEQVMLEIYDFLSSKFRTRRIENAEEIKHLRNLPPQEILSYLSLSKWKLPFFLRASRRLFQEKISSLTPYPGVPEMLKQLASQGHHLGILTSNSKENVLVFLKNNHMEYFDYVHSVVQLFGKGKALKKVMRLHRIDPASALYVGDEIRDIDAARDAGIEIASVSWGFNSRESLSACKPNYVLNEPSDLARLFQGESDERRRKQT